MSMSPNETAGETYTEMPSSLMMYPIPYPSAATGPNPNSRNAGFPQLDVDRIERFRTCQPASVKIAGSGGLSRPFAPLPLDVVLVGDVGRSSASSSAAACACASRSRCSRQYSAYRCLRN